MPIYNHKNDVNIVWVHTQHQIEQRNARIFTFTYRSYILTKRDLITKYSEPKGSLGTILHIYVDLLQFCIFFFINKCIIARALTSPNLKSYKQDIIYKSQFHSKFLFFTQIEIGKKKNFLRMCLIFSLC